MDQIWEKTRDWNVLEAVDTTTTEHYKQLVSALLTLVNKRPNLFQTHINDVMLAARIGISAFSILCISQRARLYWRSHGSLVAADQ